MLPNLSVSPFLLILPWTVAIGAIVMSRMAKRDGADLRRVAYLQVFIALAGVLGAKLFSLIEHSGVASNHALSVAGWRYPGGLVAIAIITIILKPIFLPTVTFARYADWLAPTISFGHAVQRISCVLAGCCTGPICHSWYCTWYPGGSEVSWVHAERGLVGPGLSSLPVLPLHFFLMALGFGVGVFLLRADRTRRFDGELAILFLVLHEGGKFLLEFLRDPPATSVQATSLAFAVVGLGLWVRTSRFHFDRKPRSMTTKENL